MMGDLGTLPEYVDPRDLRIKELEAALAEAGPAQQALYRSIEVRDEQTRRIKELEAQDQRWADEVSGLFDRIAELEGQREGLLTVEFENRLRIKELEANERFDLDAFYDEMQAKEDRIKELEKDLAEERKIWPQDRGALWAQRRIKELEAQVEAAKALRLAPTYNDGQYRKALVRIKELEAALEDLNQWRDEAIEFQARQMRVVEAARTFASWGNPPYAMKDDVDELVQALADYDEEA